MKSVVTRTDTDIGKTVSAAGRTVAPGARYGKPVQAGLADGSDAASAVTLGVPADRLLAEAYRLTTSCSPHFAAEIDGVTIDPDRLVRPEVDGLPVVEALRGRGVSILGIAFVGDAVEDSEATIAALGNVRRLGRLPRLDPLNAATLVEAFAANFDLEAFP